MQTFKALLTSTSSTDQLSALGELLYQVHVQLHLILTSVFGSMVSLAYDQELFSHDKATCCS